jgi:hypothetical protein
MLPYPVSHKPAALGIKRHEIDVLDKLFIRLRPLFVLQDIPDDVSAVDAKVM